MNFTSEDLEGKSILINVGILRSCFVIRINGENTVFKYNEVHSIRNYLKKYISDEQIVNIKNFIKVNMLHMGMIYPIEKKDNDNQLSLF